MSMEPKKKRKIAWGITGSGDKLSETIEAMKKIKELYVDNAIIEVYLSKAGEQVLKHYRVNDDLKVHFDRVWVEVNANSPFLSGQLQMGRYAFLLIAPATSNTVAKIAVGIADSLLSNAAVQALKAFVPVYIMPSDYKEGIISTRLPSGREMKLQIRKEDADNVRRLATMANVSILEKPEDIYTVFEKHFGSKKN
ncbi:archaeoflavoprotein AfpA [Candidatus Bathyarchaeota archaeon]|nr:archaeoflavoprotein AfpA [Candidatus Bathyarchaeota archaeon]